MFKLGRLVFSFSLLASLNAAYASPGADGAQDAGKSHSVRVPGMKCDVELTTAPNEVGSQLVPIETKNELQTWTYNKPIEITKAKYPGLLKDAREKEQEAKAMEYAAKIAQELIRIIETGDEEQMTQAQLIILQLGQLPQHALNNFQDIIKEDLAALEDPTKAPQYQRDTDNALAELTKVVTGYRTEVTADVNFIANWLDKLGLRKLGKVARTKFQSVQGAAKAIDEVLETSLAQMYKRHRQMMRARADLKMFERYAELSVKMGVEVKRLIDQYIKDNQFNEQKVAVYEKYVLEPLVDRTSKIVRGRAAVATGYEQFALLMDGNLSLISVIGNIRETAQLEITIFGAGRIIANEQRRRLDMANATLDALDDMRVQTVDQLKSQGVIFRQLPDRQIRSMKALVNTVSQLQNEIIAVADYRKTTIDKYTTAITELTADLDALVAKVEAGEEPVPGSLIERAEKKVQEQTGRDLSNVDTLPKIPGTLN